MSVSNVEKTRIDPSISKNIVYNNSIQWFNATYPDVANHLRVSASATDALQEAWGQGRDTVDLFWKNTEVTEKDKPLPEALQIYSDKVSDIAQKHGLVTEALNAGKKLCTITAQKAYEEITNTLLPETIEKIKNFENEINPPPEPIPAAPSSHSWLGQGIAVITLAGLAGATGYYWETIKSAVSHLDDTGKVGLGIAGGLSLTFGGLFVKKKVEENSTAISRKLSLAKASLPSAKAVAKTAVIASTVAAIAWGVYASIYDTALIREKASDLQNALSTLVAGTPDLALGAGGGVALSLILFPILRWALSSKEEVSQEASGQVTNPG